MAENTHITIAGSTFRRHWLQFSLATLLLLIAASSVPLAWVGTQLRSSEKEVAQRAQTLQELAKIRGRVTGWSSNSGATHIVFEGTHFDEGAIEQLEQTLVRNPNITDVYMYDTVATSGALAVLKRLNHLEEIQLERSDVTDDGLTDVGQVPSLCRLYAKGKWIKLENRQQ